MAYCDNCALWNSGYNKMRQERDDVIVEGEKPKERFFCPMYDDVIPDGVHENGPCPYFFENGR